MGRPATMFRRALHCCHAIKRAALLSGRFRPVFLELAPASAPARGDVHMPRRRPALCCLSCIVAVCRADLRPGAGRLRGLAAQSPESPSLRRLRLGLSGDWAGGGGLRSRRRKSYASPYISLSAIVAPLQSTLSCGGRGLPGLRNSTTAGLALRPGRPLLEVVGRRFLSGSLFRPSPRSDPALQRSLPCRPSAMHGRLRCCRADLGFGRARRRLVK